MNTGGKKQTLTEIFKGQGKDPFNKMPSSFQNMTLSDENSKSKRSKSSNKLPSS